MKLLFLLISIITLFTSSYAQQVYDAIGGYKAYAWETKLDVFKQDFKDRLMATEGMPGEPFDYYVITDEVGGDSAYVYFAFLENKLVRVWIDFSYKPISNMNFIALFKRLSMQYTSKFGPITKKYMPDEDKQALDVASNIVAGTYIWYNEWKDQYGKCWMQLAGSNNSLILYLYFDSEYMITHFPNIQSGLDIK